MSGIFGSEPDLPAVQAQNASVTAEPTQDVAGGVNRQKRMASLITKDWEQPTLSKKGLLGL
jgi:hypothetical protein